MPFTTKRQALSLAADEKQRLESLRRSRSGEKREVLHAGILLDLAGGMSDGAAARSNGVNRHTVALCARKFLQFGLAAALGELPRAGKGRRIPDNAIAGGTALRLPETEGTGLRLRALDIFTVAGARAEALR